MSEDPQYAVRAVVRAWSDAQLREAWRISGAELTDASRTGELSELRAAILAEWERRHPGDTLRWGGHGPAPLE